MVKNALLNSFKSNVPSLLTSNALKNALTSSSPYLLPKRLFNLRRVFSASSTFMMPLLFLSMVLKMFSTISPRALLAAAETAAESGSAEKGEEVEKDWFEAAKEEAEKKEKVGTTEEGETEKDETDITASEVFEVEDDGKEFVAPTEVDAGAAKSTFF